MSSPRRAAGRGTAAWAVLPAVGLAIPVVVGTHEAFNGNPNVWVPFAVAALDVVLVVRMARLFRSRARADDALERRVARYAAVAALAKDAIEGADPQHLNAQAADVEARLDGSDDAEFGGAVAAVLSAATVRRNGEAELAHQAIHDSLTGLPNRVLFLDRVHSAVLRSERHPAVFAVLFLDLDRFKVVNDSMGHRAGDELLIEVADRLRACARSGDTVARFGGDEFAILCQDLVDASHSMTLAARVSDALKAPFIIDDEPVVLSASIGVAVSRPDCDADGLLRDADAAMYRAKDGGRDRFEMFDDAMRARAVGRMTLEQELRAALPRGEIVVHYQPVVVLSTGATVGYEAFVRWEHPTRGLLLPSDFLDVAEETGLIVPIGGIVIEQVLADMASPEGTPALVGRWVAVNFSVRQLTDGDVVGSLAIALQRHNVDPSRLWLEITEHALARDPARASATLQGLGALGVKIAVDDFGTGYSSLTYLQRYPVDVLKIDQSFVDDFDTNPEDAAIVNAVVTLGHSLGLVVLAEGVERVEQANALKAAGCDLAQGFFYGIAAPVELLTNSVPGQLESAQPGQTSTG